MKRGEKMKELEMGGEDGEREDGNSAGEEKVLNSKVLIR